jgi:hypothetical protein
VKLTDMNVLRRMDYDDLIDRLHVEGGSFAAVVKRFESGLPTKDMLRLAIIDLVIARELGETPGPPPPRDPGVPSN